MVMNSERNIQKKGPYWTRWWSFFFLATYIHGSPATVLYFQTRLRSWNDRFEKRNAKWAGYVFSLSLGEAGYVLDGESCLRTISKDDICHYHCACARTQLLRPLQELRTCSYAPQNLQNTFSKTVSTIKHSDSDTCQITRAYEIRF